MLILPGSNALSAFRTQRLLTQLQAVDAAITGVSGRYLHFVDAGQAQALTREDEARLNGLLTYGDPFNGSDEGDAFVVIPRFGTISPWASKATDIVRNCGMGHIHRVERGIIFRVQVKTGLLGGTKKLNEASIPAVAALLHDRMTETVLRDPQDAAGLFSELQAKPLESVDVIGGGRAALERANTELLSLIHI